MTKFAQQRSKKKNILKETMNNLNSIHVHTTYSDGSNQAYEYIEEAIRLGMTAIGISDHSPVPVENDWGMQLEDLAAYIEEIEYLKKSYKKHIDVYLGLELDYIRGMDVKEYIDFNNLGLDYYIGAIHYIYSPNLREYLTVDNTKEEVDKLVVQGFASPKSFYTEYYQSVREMIKEYRPMLIAHLDVLEKRNYNKSLFDSDSLDYINEVEKTLDVIEHSLVEVNTGGWANGLMCLYPSFNILKSLKKRKIGLSINSDCHRITKLNLGYDRALEEIKKVGYEEVYNFHKGKMERIKISDLK